MEWTESAHILSNNSPPGILGGVSSISFDPFSELLWVGSNSGQLISHYSSSLQRYTSFPCHGTALKPSPTKDILVDNGNILTLGNDGIRCGNRRGVGRWSLRASDISSNMNLASMCASPLVGSSELIAGGGTGSGVASEEDQIVSINRNSGSVVRSVASEAPIVHIRKSNRMVCAGTAAGHVQLRDPRSLRVEHKLHAHPGGFIDMQVDGNLIYSVGWTIRLGHPVPEPLIKVHDVRTLRPLVPIPFAAPGGPALLGIYPKLSTTVIVASAHGHFQMVDVGNPGEGRFYQVNTGSYLTSLAMSPSSDFLAFGEADGSVRLWSNASDPSTAQFNPFVTSAPEGPDVPEQPVTVNWTTETPLSSVGMPYYSDALLSGFDYEDCVSDQSPLFNMPTKIDPAVLSSMRIVDGVGYAALPRHLRGKRNVVTGKGSAALRPSAKSKPEDRRRIGLPLFRSEKEKEAAKRAASGVDEPAVAELPSSPGLQSTAEAMPSYYHVKTIQYSKFGIEDFDFGFYNKTTYSGLETHIQNSYANAYLQALHYVYPFRILAKTHIYDACTREQCFLCEAGFLFRMLEDAKGANCQATNFLRALGNSSRAASLGLMDKEDSPGADAAYSNLIQHLNRFVLDSTAAEAGSADRLPPESHPRRGSTAMPLAVSRDSPVSQLFLVSALSKIVCGTCGAASQRSNESHVVDLIYPRKPLSNEPSPPTDFASVLRGSLVRESSMKARCGACGTPAAPLRSRRLLRSREHLPRVLSINASVHTGEQLTFWLDGVGPGGNSRRNTYLPPYLEIDVIGEDLRSRGIWNKADLPNNDEVPIYTLRAMVVQIQADNEAPHLCTIVRVPEEEGKMIADGKSKSPWYLFNDFLVRNISEDEALGFPNTWKIPAVLMFERINASSEVEPKAVPDSKILCEDTSIAWNRDPARIRHKVLSEDELPKKGTLISIDAEFVALNQEELEVRSDGTRSVIRPSRLTLARVSVLRGEGPEEALPFIDDHIYTQEPVMDYLTQFSGIIHGDLEPQSSSHTLVPLKVAYKKLRLLVDLGCIFIGHGLQKDFRIINIYVPPSQVIDTVNLYHSPSHPRKLSLRFLSWFLLKQAIQAGGEEQGHDSIEDARAALQLYRLWEGFKKAGRTEDVLEDLYEEGRRVNWRPPAPANGPHFLTQTDGFLSATGTPQNRTPVQSHAQAHSSTYSGA